MDNALLFYKKYLNLQLEKCNDYKV